MPFDEKHRPEWVPSEGGEGFASWVMKGREGSHDGLPQAPEARVEPTSKPQPRRRQLSVEEYVQGVLKGERPLLARTITLIESNSLAHQETAQAVLKALMPHTGRSIRLGITGVPGVGKSTFIEALGCHLIERGHRVAVLAVDPTSSISRGSILGDKTRMERLAREPKAFIRPSPTGGKLGGVTRKSRETMLVCEAAGFDVVLLETVGVGQSETTVRSMVDFFLLLMLAGAGDELQGIKKGIMELADAILINKADGDNLPKARVAQADYNRALHYLAPATKGWQTQAYTCSAVTGQGIPEIWGMIQEFRQRTTATGEFETRRRRQAVDWVHTMIEEELLNRFVNHPGIRQVLPDIEKAVMTGALPATAAVKELLAIFETNQTEEKLDGNQT
jgi:LAO/AO transport system kinase